MNRVNIVAVLLVLLSAILAACGNGGKQAVPCEDTTIPIEVDFSWMPENPEENENVMLRAHVTHNGLDVSNSEYVQFEIWEHSNPDYHHMVDAVNEGDGVYSYEWTFNKAGVYYAYYHVTACEMHRMEKEMIVVGSPDVEAITAEEDTVRSHMSSSHEGHGEEAVDEEHEQDEEHATP